MKFIFLDYKFYFIQYFYNLIKKTFKYEKIKKSIFLKFWF